METEGWFLGVVCRNWKIDRNDQFGLLLSACKDCIGDVRIRGTERTGKDTGAGTNGCVLLAKLQNIISALQITDKVLK